MAKQSRRHFIQRSLSTAILTTASGFALTNTVDASAASSSESSEVATTQTKIEQPRSVQKVSGPVVAYIRDVGKGQVSILAGEKEIVYTDHEFARYLMNILS